jgi:hypothetical protein
MILAPERRSPRPVGSESLAQGAEAHVVVRDMPGTIRRDEGEPGTPGRRHAPSCALSGLRVFAPHRCRARRRIVRPAKRHDLDASAIDLSTHSFPGGPPDDHPASGGE